VAAASHAHACAVERAADPLNGTGIDAKSYNICGLASLVAGWALHPLESAALPWRTPIPDSIGVLSVQQDREKDGKSRSVLRKELFLAY
jgi:hypothetical protein